MLITVIVIATLLATGVLLAEEAVIRRLRLERLAGTLQPQQFVVGVAAVIVGLIELYNGIRALFFMGIGSHAILTLLVAVSLLSASLIIAPRLWRRFADKTEAQATVQDVTGWAAARGNLIGLACLILAVVVLIRAL